MSCLTNDKISLKNFRGKKLILAHQRCNCGFIRTHLFINDKFIVHNNPSNKNKFSFTEFYSCRILLHFTCLNLNKVLVSRNEKKKSSTTKKYKFFFSVAMF